MICRRKLCCLASLLFLSSAAFPVLAQPALQTHEEARIEAFQERIDRHSEAYNRGDIESIMDLYLPKAGYRDSIKKVKGKKAVREAIALHIDDGAQIQFTTESVERIEEGVIQSGRYSYLPKGNPEYEMGGDFRIHWRQVDGRWRVEQYHSSDPTSFSNTEWDPSLFPAGKADNQ